MTPLFPAFSSVSASLVPQTVAILPIALSTSPLVRYPSRPDPLRFLTCSGVSDEVARRRETDGASGLACEKCPCPCAWARGAVEEDKGEDS